MVIIEELSPRSVIVAKHVVRVTFQRTQSEDIRSNPPGLITVHTVDGKHDMYHSDRATFKMLLETLRNVES